LKQMLEKENYSFMDLKLLSEVKHMPLIKCYLINYINSENVDYKQHLILVTFKKGPQFIGALF
jgi:hypothetical protein